MSDYIPTSSIFTKTTGVTRPPLSSEQYRQSVIPDKFYYSLDENTRQEVDYITGAEFMLSQAYGLSYDTIRKFGANNIVRIQERNPFINNKQGYYFAQTIGNTLEIAYELEQVGVSEKLDEKTAKDLRQRYAAEARKFEYFIKNSRNPFWKGLLTIGRYTADFAPSVLKTIFAGATVKAIARPALMHLGIKGLTRRGGIKLALKALKNNPVVRANPYMLAAGVLLDIATIGIPAWQSWKSSRDIFKGHIALELSGDAGKLSDGRHISEVNPELFWKMASTTAGWTALSEVAADFVFIGASGLLRPILGIMGASKVIGMASRVAGNVTGEVMRKPWLRLIGGSAGAVAATTGTNILQEIGQETYETYRSYFTKAVIEIVGDDPNITPAQKAEAKRAVQENPDAFSAITPEVLKEITRASLTFGVFAGVGKFATGIPQTMRARAQAESGRRKQQINELMKIENADPSLIAQSVVNVKGDKYSVRWQGKNVVTGKMTVKGDGIDIGTGRGFASLPNEAQDVIASLIVQKIRVTKTGDYAFTSGNKKLTEAIARSTPALAEVANDIAVNELNVKSNENAMGVLKESKKNLGEDQKQEKEKLDERITELENIQENLIAELELSRAQLAEQAKMSTEDTTQKQAVSIAREEELSATTGVELIDLNNVEEDTFQVGEEGTKESRIVGDFAQGLMHRPILLRTNDGKLFIVDGHHRRKKAIESGHNMQESVVLKEGDKIPLSLLPKSFREHIPTITKENAKLVGALFNALINDSMSVDILLRLYREFGITLESSRKNQKIATQLIKGLPKDALQYYLSNSQIDQKYALAVAKSEIDNRIKIEALAYISNSENNIDNADKIESAIFAYENLESIEKKGNVKQLTLGQEDKQFSSLIKEFSQAYKKVKDLIKNERNIDRAIQQAGNNSLQEYEIGAKQVTRAEQNSDIKKNMLATLKESGMYMPDLNQKLNEMAKLIYQNKKDPQIDVLATEARDILYGKTKEFIETYQKSEKQQLTFEDPEPRQSVDERIAENQYVDSSELKESKSNEARARLEMHEKRAELYDTYKGNGVIKAVLESKNSEALLSFEFEGVDKADMENLLHDLRNPNISTGNANWIKSLSETQKDQVASALGIEYAALDSELQNIDVAVEARMEMAKNDEQALNNILQEIYNTELEQNVIAEERQVEISVEEKHEASDVSKLEKARDNIVKMLQDLSC